MSQRSGDRAFVTRGELKGIMQQILDNMGELSNGLMQDVNSMYRNHVFPMQIRTQVLEELLYEKTGMTKEEVDALFDKKILELQEKAKVMAERLKEDSENESGVVSEDVDEESNIIPLTEGNK